ncbi:MAG TPA: hypothetical protein VI653_24035 [Steroidobacteraceae bacterium]
MSSPADLRPGDLMFTTIPGIGGKLIALGEKINDKSVTWDVAKKVQHVGVVTSSCYRWPPRGAAGPLLVQAMPAGAEEVEIGSDYWNPSCIYVRPGYKSEYTPPRVAQFARSYIGVPYSFLDYAAIAGRHMLALKPTQRTLFDRYVSSTKHMICSQLADQALSDANFHVFDDGRIPQDVTPAALYSALLDRPGTQICSSAFDWFEPV